MKSVSLINTTGFPLSKYIMLTSDVKLSLRSWHDRRAVRARTHTEHFPIYYSTQVITEKLYINSKMSDWYKGKECIWFLLKRYVHSDSIKVGQFLQQLTNYPASRDACWSKEFVVGKWCHETSHPLLPQHARVPDSLCICDEVQQQVLYSSLITPSLQPPGWCQRTYCRQWVERFLSSPTFRPALVRHQPPDTRVAGSFPGRRAGKTYGSPYTNSQRRD